MELTGKEYFYGKHYIAHHGIPGQKWGERNGPPYPLNQDTSSFVSSSKNEIKNDLKNGIVTDDDILHDKNFARSVNKYYAERKNYDFNNTHLKDNKYTNEDLKKIYLKHRVNETAISACNNATTSLHKFRRNTLNAHTSNCFSCSSAFLMRYCSGFDVKAHNKLYNKGKECGCSEKREQELAGQKSLFNLKKIPKDREKSNKELLNKIIKDLGSKERAGGWMTIGDRRFSHSIAVINRPVWKSGKQVIEKTVVDAQGNYGMTLEHYMDMMDKNKCYILQYTKYDDNKIDYANMLSAVKVKI